MWVLEMNLGPLEEEQILLVLSQLSSPHLYLVFNDVKLLDS